MNAEQKEEAVKGDKVQAVEGKEDVDITSVSSQMHLLYKL